MMLEKS